MNENMLYACINLSLLFMRLNTFFSRIHFKSYMSYYNYNTVKITCHNLKASGFELATEWFGTHVGNYFNYLFLFRKFISMSIHF